MRRSELIKILELNYCFRDYRILPKKYYGSLALQHKKGTHFRFSTNAVKSKADINKEIQVAISSFYKTGGTIYFYLDNKGGL